MKRMMICSIALLALASCTAGDFCQVVPFEKRFDPATARAVLTTDREVLRQIAVENEFGRRHCDW
jgi:hypothetical protein